MSGVDDAIERSDGLAEEDRLDEALEVLDAALRRPLSRLERARLSIEAGWKLYDCFPDREDGARRRAEEALALLGPETDTPEALAVRGAAHCLLAHCPEDPDGPAGAHAARQAVDVLERVMREPSRPEWQRWAVYDAARAYLVLEDGDRAVTCSERFLGEARGHTARRAGLVVLSDALRLVGRLAEAEQNVEEALRLTQSQPYMQPALYQRRGLIERATARPREARASFERAVALLEADPTRHPAWFFQETYGSLAEVTAEQGDRARTAGVLRRLLEFYPDDDRNRLGVLDWLAGCCVELGLYAEARAHYQAVVASPAATEDEQAAAASQVLWCWAAAASRNRDFRIARDLFGRLLDYNGDDDGKRHVLLLWLGNVHYALQEYEQARDCYEEVLTSAWASEDQRGTAQEWVDWSVARIQAGAGRHVEAAARMERRLARYPQDDPERWAALLFLGECCAAAGDLARAGERMRRCGDRPPPRRPRRRRRAAGSAAGPAGSRENPLDGPAGSHIVYRAYDIHSQARRTMARRTVRPIAPRGPRAAPPAPSRSAEATALFPAPIEHQTLEELAYRHIRRALVDGQLAPGQRIVASAVARAAGISRIPVMQALRRLESEGFVRINPHRDVVVASLSSEEFRERFLLMAALEALCLREADGKIAPAFLKRLRAVQDGIVAARAAGNTAGAVAADTDFHRLLWEVSGLKQVVQVLQNVWDRGEYYRVIMHARRGGFARESIAEHEEIIRALEAGDASRAARAVETHRMRAMARLAATS